MKVLTIALPLITSVCLINSSLACIKRDHSVNVTHISTGDSQQLTSKQLTNKQPPSEQGKYAGLKPNQLHYQYLIELRESRKDNTSPEVMNMFFTPQYLEKHDLAKNGNGFAHNSEPKCKIHSLNKRQANHKTSTLNYTVYDMCKEGVAPFKQKVKLKHDKKSGWQIDSISESSFVQSEFSKKMDNIFAEYVAVDSFHKYLDSVRDGKLWEQYKEYFTPRFVANIEESFVGFSNEELKEDELAKKRAFSCQKYTSELQTRNGRTQNITYKITNQCNKNDSQKYQRVTFKFMDDGSWSIDNVTNLPDDWF